MVANPKILGSSLIGLAFICGALVINHFRPQQVTIKDSDLAALTVAASTNEYIPETDKNGDGVEDWRENFLTETPLDISTSTASSTYIPPTTLTDQVGVQLLQSSLRNKAMGKNALSNTELVTNTTDKVKSVVQDIMYTSRDFKIVPTIPEAIRTYGNTLGQSLIDNNIQGSENELDLLNRAVQSQDKIALEKIKPLAAMYKSLRDEALAVPVPDKFVTNHVNLVNSYNAVYHDLDSMQLIFDDPMVALLRIKRYQDDVTGLAISLRNTYNSGRPYASLFSENDPATVFVAFSSQ